MALLTFQCEVSCDVCDFALKEQFNYLDFYCIILRLLTAIQIQYLYIQQKAAIVANVIYSNVSPS